MTTRLTGLIAATFSPLHDDGRLNLDCLEAYAEHLLRGGISGVFVGGTTGECHSLTVDERRRLTAEWVRVLRGRMPVVVHVGHNALPDACELAAHAQDVGAAAIGAMAPCFFRPDSLEPLIDYCAAIAAAAPQLPFYFYDIPSMTGVRISTVEFLKQGAARIPSLLGVKFTNTDLMGLQECLAADDGRFDVLFGHDEMLLAGLAMGVRGAIGSTYNLAPALYRRILAAFDAGDLETARREQQRSVNLVRALISPGFIAAAKFTMSLLGVNCGPVRLPLHRLSSADADSLRERIVRLGLLEMQVSGE